MSIKPRATKRQIKAARKWILEHPLASMRETLIATRVSAGTISNLRRDLIAEGHMTPFSHTPGSGKVKPLTEFAAPPAGDPDQPNDESEDERVLTGDMPMTREERRARLEKLVRSDNPDHAIRANTAIEAMDRNTATADDYGPPAPLHLEDAELDVADMIEALAGWGGEESVRRAVELGLSRFLADTAPAPPPSQGPPEETPTPEPSHA